jgi:rhodanese-related sulfurtransferase
MKRFKQYVIWTFFLLLAAGQNPCLAITANELKDLIEKKAQVTIIDARSRLEFSRGHILTAINIPCDVLKNNPLPPVGKVVVYGDGVQKEALQSAVEALNRQQGIDADILKGGYPLWAGRNNERRPQFGIEKDIFASITYQDLKNADSAADQDITIIDLRAADHSKGSDKALIEKTTREKTISNLNEIFPALKIIRPDVHFSIGTGTNGLEKISGLSGIPPKKSRHLYVLIDMGDGTSRKIARRLKAKGINQTAILIGGEKIIQRKGEPGVASKITEF